jgi:hypothetical protein
MSNTVSSDRDLQWQMPRPSACQYGLAGAGLERGPGSVRVGPAAGPGLGPAEAWWPGLHSKFKLATRNASEMTVTRIQVLGKSFWSDIPGPGQVRVTGPAQAGPASESGR